MAARAHQTAARIDIAADGGDSLRFETMQLLSGVADLERLCAELGWRYRGETREAEYRAVVMPTTEHRVKRYKLVYQDNQLVVITAQYRAPNRARVRLYDRYSFSNRTHNQWAMCNANRQILALIDVAGTRLQVIHTGSLRERDEVARLYRTLLPDL